MTALGMSCTTPHNTRYMRSENAKSVEAHAEYDSYYLPVVKTPRMPYPSLPSFHELSLPGRSESRHTGSTNFVEAPLRRSTPTHSGRSLCRKSSSLSPGTSTGGMSKSNVDPGPAQKQKRRRQILSCTECKRRKIKCDRLHPCGPCARRNDGKKCEWHEIPPVDKGVSRAEYLEVLARLSDAERKYEELYDIVSTLMSKQHPDICPTSFRPADFPPDLGPLRPAPSGLLSATYRTSPGFLFSAAHDRTVLPKGVMPGPLNVPR